MAQHVPIKREDVHAKDFLFRCNCTSGGAGAGREKKPFGF
jgi:hypothetical protein